MLITIDFPDGNKPLLEKAVSVKNKYRQQLADEAEGEGDLQLASVFRKEISLERYVYTTLMQASKRKWWGQ
ncbi:hypothetical protein [Sporomusa termitida]|uniref:Uncharacterized protein n=1 Tax=Sporomusa termitida TaxID=2377 RepID=A0A517DSL4_9FIRM|nr:hypothetical protein [Sporomusa termitida]QDR80308.1 hypothetical protein SPTER_16310 [Sporomusa termitida]